MQDMKSVVEMIAVSVLMLLSTALYAQDKIYFNDAAPENADIREIGDDYVLYRQWGSPDGPDYRASLSRVYRIVFRDGTERVFSGQSLFGIDAAGSSPMVIPGIITYRRGRFYDGPYMLSSEQIMDYIGYTSYGSVYMRLGALADNYNSRHGYGMRSARPAVLSLGCCTNGLGLAFNF